MKHIFYYIFLTGLLALTGIPQMSMAQNDAQMSMYWAVPTAYNPAAVGCDSALHISAFNRMQWVGVKNAPRTLFAAADMPFKVKSVRNGVGAYVLNDKAGLFESTWLGLQYSYSMKLWLGRLALGLQAGMVNQSFSGSDVYIPEGDAWNNTAEGLPSGDVSGMAFDAGFGAYYELEHAYVGVSALHLTESQIDMEDAFAKEKRIFYFNAGGNIPIKRTLLIVQPSFLLKTTGQAMQVDYTLRLTYDKKFWGGITLRPKDAVVMMVGADVGAVRLGYAYDIGVSALAKASNGSHELMATYSYKLDLDKHKQHAHKSIRIL